MQHMRKFACIVVMAALASILLGGGCGNGGGDVTPDPERGAQQKQSRIDAYGKAGIPVGKGVRIDPQAAARSKANQGGR